MTAIYRGSQIEQLEVPADELLAAIEDALKAHSMGQVVSPPIGHLPLTRPRGDVHIKYGYFEADGSYVVKLASGIYEEWGPGTPTAHGLMLLFDRRTTEVRCILLEDGLLTDLRTGAAGAIASKALAPPGLKRIGMIGTGRQSDMQARFLQHTLECRQLLVCGRSPEKAQAAAARIRRYGFDAQPTTDVEEVLAGCRLVVTVTAAQSPLFSAEQVRPGTHVTAVGADAPGKQELPSELFERSALVVADSIDQAADHGDASHALKAGTLDRRDLVELGGLLSGSHPYQRQPGDITIADLTGIAAQDIAIAKLYAERLESEAEGS